MICDNEDHEYYDNSGTLYVERDRECPMCEIDRLKKERAEAVLMLQSFIEDIDTELHLADQIKQLGKRFYDAEGEVEGKQKQIMKVTAHRNELSKDVYKLKDTLEWIRRIMYHELEVEDIPSIRRLKELLEGITKALKEAR